MFDFDRVIDRHNTHASKWDNMARLSGITAPDAIPMWVADMDFAAPPGVTEALLTEVKRGTHGYYADTGSWAAACADWMAKRHGLTIDPAWISPTPGIVSGIGLILQAVTEPGDDVVLFPPVYHAFRKIIVANGRNILDVHLVQENGRHAMDFEALRAKLTPRTKVVVLCSPHNPGGTVWTPDELRALAAFCAEHDLILISDEIHCDLVFAGNKHTPTITAAPEIADRLITCVAATKTFNLAGAHVGACFTSNRGAQTQAGCAHRRVGLELLQQLRHAGDGSGLAHRRTVARRAAALSHPEPRPVRPAHRGCRARRALDAACRHLSCLGRLFRHRPCAERGGGPGQGARAHLRQPWRTVRTGRRELAAL